MSIDLESDVSNRRSTAVLVLLFPNQIIWIDSIKLLICFREKPSCNVRTDHKSFKAIDLDDRLDVLLPNKEVLVVQFDGSLS